MNLRFIFLIGILLILVGVVLVSSIQIVMFYMRTRGQQEADSVEPVDSKEQIISDLADENERLKRELDSYKQDE
ncbi:MAG: hypothetical protein AAF490_29825 [Chloroflexota bacterium]